VGQRPLVLAGAGVTRAVATPPRLARAERRAAIIAGAAAAFARGGYAATSMADVAAAVGVSHLIVYRHFESKETLYEAVLERALYELARALKDERAIGSYGPTPAMLLGAARADRCAFEVLWRHATREADFARFADRARDLLRDVTEVALAPHVAPDHLRWAVRATDAYVVEAVLVWVEDGDPRYDARFVAATNAALQAGVRSWAKSS
jgi:AcrR family transcriptional regulator